MEGETQETQTPINVPAPGLIALMEQMGVMASFIINPHGDWISNPSSLLRLLSMGSEAPDATNLFDLVHPNDQSECAATLANVIESGEAETKRLRLCTRSEQGRKTLSCHLVFLPRGQVPAEYQDYFVQAFTEHPSERKSTPQLCVIVIPKDGDAHLCQRSLQTHKLVNLGALSAGIAHDLNNLLTGMGAFTHLLKSEITDERLLRYLDTIDKTIEKSSSLTRSITDYLREDHSVPNAVDPVQCLRDIIYIIKRSLNKQITLSTCLPTACHRVAIKRSELNQVFLNLLINARDAIPHKGTISIRASYELSNSKTSADEFVLSVEDNGIGIPSDRQALIFDPFFTTKAEMGGTGLGLTVINTITKRSGGSIEVESAPGIRTSFTVRLPLADVRAKADDTGPDRPWFAEG